MFTNQLFKICRLASRGSAVVNIRSFAASARVGENSNYPGASSPFVNKLQIHSAKDTAAIPCYRILNREGELLNEKEYPDDVSDERLVEWYKQMCVLNQMDNILYDSQRQGRISFYMTNYGEEGAQIGSASALDINDIIYAQYREAGVLLHRGFTLEDFMNQCYSNHKDLGKGRQMPVHYGTAKLNFHTISSPLGTQLPQATGAAYALKLKENNQNCVICYFGDGAASEGDAHPAFNFSATLDCPVLFFCRNNGYAISTPTKEQYRGDGIASRAVGYGMHYVRTDGNDILAVYNTVKKARQFAIENQKPVLIEAMTYRVGHHSTSDDASAYRKDEELSSFAEDSPIERLRQFLTKKGLWSDDMEDDHQTSTRKIIREEFSKAEKLAKPSLDEIFTDVYDEIPKHLQQQYDQVKEQIEKYPNEYPTERYLKQ